MCGIAGAVFWNGSLSESDAASRVQTMTDAMAHRGPDGQGVFQTTREGTVVALGHRRLSIIDLSDRAAQPMHSAHAPIVVTYNGEVYNFQAVRKELEAFGRQFRTTSDTEVILQGYEQWGARVVDRLRGMFALAIWDGRDGTLFIARDRLGIKPLYVYRTAAGVLFASEISALLASRLVPRQLDGAALDQYLAYQTVPAPRTLIAGVESLLPGHRASLSRHGAWEPKPYWSLRSVLDQEGGRTSPSDGRQRTAELLQDTTALHLVSDVPVGVFLSGGIDSAVIATLVRQAGVRPLTFTVGFPGSPLDESEEARTMARALDSEHTEIGLTEAALLEQIPSALSALDHPSGDAINTYLVAKAVHEAGIKVALSGLGGDELFGGYASFERMQRLAGWRGFFRYSPVAARRVAAAAVRRLGSSVASSKTALLLETDGSVPQAFPVLRQMFSPEQRQELLGAATHAERTLDDPYVALLESVARHRELDTMTMVSFAEARTYMHDVLLRDTDQMSMRHALEVRVPLLDHLLVEHVMALPEAIKHPNGVMKRLLVESMGGALPSSVTSRPKRGFVLPFDVWMRGPLRPLCEHHLGPSGLAQRLPLFQRAAVADLWDRFLSARGPVTWSRPWTLIALGAWAERHGVSA